MGTKHIGVTTLTFQGHVTSTVTWPFDSQVAISYRCCIVTMSLSRAVFEIMGTKHIGVTTLTFLDHVTSSVTWLFDSQVAISYRCFIVTKSLSPAVSEIMATKHISLYLPSWWINIYIYILGSRPWPFRVISHVTIRLGMGYFLLVVLWTQVSICNGFRDILPQTSCAHRHNAESSSRMRDFTWHVKFKYVKCKM